jgi:hypothetical protein
MRSMGQVTLPNNGNTLAGRAGKAPRARRSYHQDLGPWSNIQSPAAVDNGAILNRGARGLDPAPTRGQDKKKTAAASRRRTAR